MRPRVDRPPNDHGAANAPTHLKDLVRRAPAPGRPVNPRALTNEARRQCAQRLAEHAGRNLARVSKAAARSGAVLFIAAGPYSMREEIASACRGLAAEIDRPR